MPSRRRVPSSTRARRPSRNASPAARPAGRRDAAAELLQLAHEVEAGRSPGTTNRRRRRVKRNLYRAPAFLHEMNPPVDQAAVEALPESTPLPVFVSSDGRRARVLRLVGRVVAGLTVLWLVSLLAGVIGVGRFPGVPLPSTDERSPAPAAAPSDHTARGRAGSPEAARKGAETTSRPNRVESRAVHPSGDAATSQGRSSAPPGGPGTGATLTHRSSGRASEPPSAARAPATAPGAARKDFRAEAPSGPTTAPGASRAEPSPSAREHSPRWSDTGG